MNANMLHNWDKWAEAARRSESHLFDFIFVLGVCTDAYLRGHKYMVLHMHLCFWYTVLQGLSLIIFGFGGGGHLGFFGRCCTKKKINVKITRTTLSLVGFGSGWSAGSLTGAFLSLKQEAIGTQTSNTAWTAQLLELENFGQEFETNLPLRKRQ